MMKSQVLSHLDKDARIQLCELLKKKPTSFWGQVSYCDELLFSYDREGKVFISTGSIPPNKSNSNSTIAVMIVIAQSGPNSIFKIEGRYGSDQFLGLLQKNMSLLDENDTDHTYIIDRFPVHLSSSVKCWFDNNKGKSLILLPLKSPDLTPISKLSDYIINKVNSEKFDIDNTADLWDAVQKVFNDRSSTHAITGFASQMPNIVEEILTNGGDAIEV